MPTVGPTLPPHLQKRKRSPSDPEDPSSPPHKIQAAIGPAPLLKNPDELKLDDESSDDGYGPSAPASKPKTKTSSPPPKRILGPAPPPSKNPDELDAEDESSEDDYGPSAQPPAPPKRVLGPAPPPANLAEMPSHPANPDSDDSSDDDYGPSLPPAPGSAAAALLQQRAQDEQRALVSAERAEAAKPQRADWMLAPPSDSDWTSRVDPTKLKNRKFASGKGSKAPAEKSGVSAIWTETPEEKRQRLEDEVLGRKDKGASSSAKSRGTEDSREDRETARRIKEYNERNRNKSLMDEVSERGGGGKEKEDDPSKRGFDREKDMALGGRLGHGAKKEMLAKAADFGSRFQKGRYL